MCAFSSCHDDTRSTFQIHTRNPEALNSQRARHTSWTVPVTDKWAAECTDRPCDCSWHWSCYKSAQCYGRPNCAKLDRTLALTRATATADQSVTLLENCPSDWEKTVVRVRNRRQSFFVLLRQGLCKVRRVVMVWGNKWVKLAGLHSHMYRQLHINRRGGWLLTGSSCQLLQATFSKLRMTNEKLSKKSGAFNYRCPAEEERDIY